MQYSIPTSPSDSIDQAVYSGESSLETVHSAGTFIFNGNKCRSIVPEEAIRLMRALRYDDAETIRIQTVRDGKPELYRSEKRVTHGQSYTVQEFCICDIPPPYGKAKRQVRCVNQTGNYTISEFARRRPYLLENSSARIGICFGVNVLQPGAKRRGNDTIQRVAAVFIDLDGAPLPADGFPLLPTAIVESSPGRWHVYWAVSDLPLSEFTAAQKHLAKLYGGDEAVSDLARVMRLPGYWHGKAEESFLSRLVELNADAQYTRADLLGELV